MRNAFILSLLLIIPQFLSAQWTTLPIPFATRYDDVFFIDDTLGWAVGSDGFIFHTKDAGASWIEQTDTHQYLRSIEFATPTLGFCGTLGSGFFKTTDGGTTWINIGDAIDITPPRICGLSAPTPEVIYGCGVWSSPAYIIKSTDGGDTWITMDMSALASALVDILFISADTGFVSGSATTVRGKVGIILSTTDGGQSWTESYHTLRQQEYVWKLQTPDDVHFFGSIENGAGGSTVIAKSSDNGLHWSTVVVDEAYHYIQAIGFLDSLHGWTGGYSTLLETTDGGDTWTQVNVGTDYNRFFRINSYTAYLTGGQIYKYTDSLTSVRIDPLPYDEVHSMHVYPNPANEDLTIDVQIRSKTHCVISLFAEDGQWLQTIYDQPNVTGEKSFSVSLRDIPSQKLYLSMHTNEGVITREVIKGL